MSCKSCSKTGKYKRYNTIEKVRSLTKALIDEINNDKVALLKRVERLNICQGCDEYDSKNKRCTICTCYIESKIKYINQYCPHPDRKW
jgi:ribosomal protein L32